MFQSHWHLGRIPNINAAIRDAKSRHVRFRRSAAIALRFATISEREEALKHIEYLLEDNEPSVRIEAAISAAMLGIRLGGSGIEKMLGSPIMEERAAALDFFAKCGRTDDFECIKKVWMNEKDLQIRCKALETLCLIDSERGKDIIVGEINNNQNLQDEYIRTIIMLVSEIMEAPQLDIIKKFLCHNSIEVRIETARALAMNEKFEDHEKLEEILLSGTKIGNKDLGEVALEGLCKLSSYLIGTDSKHGESRIREEAVKNFRRIFINKREKIFWAAICCREKSEKANSYLKRIYSNDNRELSLLVLWAAGLCSLLEWVPVMEEYANSSIISNDPSSEYVIAALGKVNLPESIAALERIEKNVGDEKTKTREMIRIEIENSIKMFGRRKKESDER